ncbi:MAG: bifunctional demethylmenaquinone methyltransferase/2-methoxy-6-polyprenyl-1,4-benzoquinol methylase UbiE [Phycisphaerales bacterium]
MPETGPAWSAQALAANPHADAEKARKVQAMFAAIARRYDLNNRLHSFGQDQRWRRATVAAAGVGPGSRVLDVACGTGDLSEAFADAGASVVGVDFTPQMLEIAAHKAAAHPARPGREAVRYEQGDAMALRFPDASFDAVSIAFGLRNVADPARALAEFRRVLRPGGRLLVLEFAEPSNALLRWGSNLYTHRIMPWTASWIARDRSGAYHYLPRSVTTFLTPQDLQQAMQRAGFVGCASTPLTFGICAITRGQAPAAS